VEGAFATALYLVFYEHVVRRHDVNDPVVVARTDGSCDVVAVNNWMSGEGVRTRFMEIIWKPFLSLNDVPKETTFAFIDAMKARNSPGLWPALKLTLNKLYIAVEPE
jgi:hypothetical protein